MRTPLLEVLPWHWFYTDLMGPVYEGPQLPRGHELCQCFCCWCWQTTAEAAVVGCTVYAERAILEDGPFVEIPTYCASFCFIYIWHGKFHLQR